MSSNEHERDARTGDGRDPVDWDRYESEVADVVDLDAERGRRENTQSGDGDELGDWPAVQRAPRSWACLARPGNASDRGDTDDLR
jgi:hypothetical protein